MEEDFEIKLRDCTKLQVINYAMQIRFERNFLQSQLDKFNDFIPLIPDGKVQEIKEKLTPDEMGVILEDFIYFINEIKGHRVGVGLALIRRYLNDIYGVKK